ncbi:peroxiredoxin [Rhodovibrio salinarum]|uniref:Glutathione-dependent peroxiredoxin n=1 Tax=Rhodovibrio salinarum TaxID=1087 RepID=A0A934QFY7_9PROT|nr:peroxiredoxin [Rhodovibrio salinarum]MBK1696069.1 peroxiredoxin [Rhodovibrio salinarum]
MIKVGDELPDATLRKLGQDGIDEVTAKDFFKGRKVALIGVPGAYTPTCSNEHLPGFVEKAKQFHDKGVDEVACMSVNDPFVLKAWGEHSNVGDSVTLLSDGNAELTQKMGLEFDGSGAGLGTRCKRFAMLVDNGVVKALNVEDSPGSVEVTNADKLLAEL